MGGQTKLRAFLRTLKPTQALDPVVRFETAPGEQLQVDWVGVQERGKPAARLLRDTGVQPRQLRRICERYEGAVLGRVIN